MKRSREETNIKKFRSLSLEEQDFLLSYKKREKNKLQISPITLPLDVVSEIVKYVDYNTFLSITKYVRISMQN